MKIFITGGAGYIGSHIIKILGEKTDHEIITYDNFSSGSRKYILYGKYTDDDIRNELCLNAFFYLYKPDVVIHLAASIEVEESINNPIKYYENNVIGSFNIIKKCIEYNVKNLIFASSAAVYGNPKYIPIMERDPLSPINPYGTTKMIVEKMIQEICPKHNINYTILRFFNVAGADIDGKIGQDYKNSTHLITRALKTAKGEFDKLTIFGNDYDTYDGTCIRDYIHVNDLAEIVLKLVDSKSSNIFNCGYGTGFSNKNIIDMVKKVTNIDFPVKYSSKRRKGDPSILIANNTKIWEELGWEPRHNNLEYIIETAWNWEKKLNVEGDK